MKNPILYAKAYAHTAAYIVTSIPENVRYRKERRIRRIEGELYEQMIADSQAKIGPYKPASIPVQIWA